MTETSIKPFINLNGTSRDSLREENLHVFEKLNDLHAAMCQATPHGRDYRSNEDAQRARDEHFADRKAVADLISKYEGILLHIMDA